MNRIIYHWTGGTYHPNYIDFEVPTVTTTETIEIPAVSDSVPNIKIKAENVYINFNNTKEG